jgi:branched-chain amino acid transport system ATP-binding protein
VLKVADLHTHYGHIHALKGVSMEVSEGSIITLIGNNGAGKSTLLKTISGLIVPTSGSITFLGKRIHGQACDDIVKMGISQTPEGRRVFFRSPVIENLEMGAYTRKDTSKVNKDIDSMMKRFPILRERRNQMAGTLSGGEQQMLVIARALMSRPKLLMLDEPSLGLMPALVNEVFKIIQEIRAEGVTILLVEQNARKALGIADYAYVLEIGEIVLEGPAAQIRDMDQVRRAYLGEGRPLKPPTTN